MESVDKATTTIAAPMPPAPEEMTEVVAEEAAATSPDRSDPLQQAWSQFASAAAAFITPLAQALSSPSPSTGSTRSPIERLITRDEHTGQPCLKLPLPDPQALTRLAELLNQWSSASPPK
jgi:hypothetical protein